MGRSITVALAALAMLVAVPRARAQSDDSAETLLVEAAKRAIARGNYRSAGRLLDRALSVNPRRIDAYVLRASVFAMRRDYENGVAVMRRARTLAPANADVLTALGSQLMLAGKRGEAVALLERVVTTAPQRYDAQVVLGHYYITRKQWNRAIKSLAAYFASRPKILAREDPIHRAALARAYLRVGKRRRAVALYRQVVAAEPKNAAGRLGLAWATASISCKRALPLLLSLEDLASRYPSVLLVRARCALMTGGTAQALRLAKRYLDRRANDPHAWALLGRARQRSGNIRGARVAFAAALAREPGNQRWSFRLAHLERISGAPQRAVKRLRRAGPSPGRVDEWTLELGEALLASRKYDELRRLLGPWVVSKPKRAQGRALLGLALYHSGNRVKAIEHLEAAAGLDAKQTRVRGPLVRALIERGVAAFRKPDLAAAQVAFQRAMRVDANPVVLRNLGAVLLRRGKPRAAIANLELSLRKRSQRDTAFLLGRAYRLSKRHRSALAMLIRARKLSVGTGPSNAAIVLEIAATRMAAGEYGDAVAVLGRALRAAKGADKARLNAAFYAAARQAASHWLRVGAFTRAYRLLLNLERRLPSKLDKRRIGVACDLALAATGAGLRDTALRRLRRLKGVTCPFPAPANRLAIPILLAWNEGLDGRRATRSINRLQALRRRKLGVAGPLARVASRDVALRAAAQAYRTNQLRRARVYLSMAARVDRRSREVIHNQAVLLLASGKIDAAIRRLKSIAAWVPMAHVNLGIAYGRKGDAKKALEHFRRARRAGVRFAPLARWITTKQRVWGLP